LHVESLRQVRRHNSPLITKDRMLRACHSSAVNTCDAFQTTDYTEECFQLYHVPDTSFCSPEKYDRGALPFSKSLYDMNTPVQMFNHIFRACTAGRLWSTVNISECYQISTWRSMDSSSYCRTQSPLIFGYWSFHIA
jgi:hypothetical protein